MGLDTLLSSLRAYGTGTPVSPRYTDGVSTKTAPDKACTPGTPVTPELINVGTDIEIPRQQDNRDTTLEEQRRNRVLAMLAEEPDKSRAVCTDMDSDPDNVILTLAIRYVATCELKIPKERYDPFQIMGMLDRQDIHPIH